MKTNNPIKKGIKKLNTHFTKEEMKMATGIWKDAQNH